MSTASQTARKEVLQVKRGLLRRFCFLCLSGVVLAGVSGCGTDVFVPAGSTGTTTPTNPGTPTLDGNWEFTITPVTGTAPFSLLTGPLIQGGAEASGDLNIGSILRAQDPGVCYAGQATIPLQGPLKTSLAITLNSFSVGGRYLKLTGSVAADRGSLASGGYQITGCAGSSAGSFVGTKVQLFSGTYNAASPTASAPTLSQLSNMNQLSYDGQGYYHLAGNATFTSAPGSTPCFTTGSILQANSTITGRQVHLIIATNEAGSVSTVDVVGILTADAKSLQMTSVKIIGGGCAGTGGTGTLTHS